MKTLIALLVGALLTLGIGCTSPNTGSDESFVPKAQADNCPVCKDKFNYTGKPGHKGEISNTLRKEHLCPECGTEVTTVKENGKWVHRAVAGKTMADCKLCNPKS